MAYQDRTQSNRTSSGLKPPSPMRPAVLHLAADMELGPLAREVVDLSVQTHRAGWRPLVASAGGSLVLEAERAAVRHTCLPLATKSLFFGWRNRVALERLIERERPVLIHAHGVDLAGLGTKLSVRRNLPLLIDITEPCPITASRRKALQLAANRGARFRVPSHYMADFLTKDMGLNTQYLSVIRPGVDMQWFDAVRVTPERINQLYKLWRLPEQSTVIIMATPMATGYGHRLLLEALTEMKGTDLYVVLIGQDQGRGGVRKTVEALVESMGLEGKIIMPDNCTDWPAACWLSSIVVAANAMPRGQGAELLAAQAIGRPVIVTDCGANAEMVKKDETAWVIAPDDRAALVDALREALAMSAARRIDLALRTRAFISESFPMEAWRDGIFTLYGQMLSPAVATSPAAAA